MPCSAHHYYNSSTSATTRSDFLSTPLMRSKVKYFAILEQLALQAHFSFLLQKRSVPSLTMGKDFFPCAQTHSSCACVGAHGQITWIDRCPLSIRNLNFLLGFGGKFFWLDKVSRRLFYSIFTPVLLVLPVVGTAPRTQQHAAGKGT